MNAHAPVMAMFFLSLWAVAQQLIAQASPAGPANTAQLPSGTLITVEIPRVLDARKLKMSDEIQARVTSDLIVGGRMVVPSGAKVLGKVVDLHLAGKDDPDTRLLVVFEKITTQEGRSFHFAYPAFVKALAPDQRVAMAHTNFNDLPIKAELGKTMDRVTNWPVLPGDSNSVMYGVISPIATGVFGFDRLKLRDTPMGVYIIAPKGNIKLEYGAQMVLSVPTPAK